MMLATLGMFIFETSSAPFEELSRRRDWRYGSADRLGAPPAHQALGTGPDEITLTGKIIPQLGHKFSSIETLAEMAGQMAKTGEALPLVDGTGRVLGNFVIRNLDEVHRYLLDNGRARVVEFSLTLMAVD